MKTVKERIRSSNLARINVERVRKNGVYIKGQITKEAIGVGFNEGKKLLPL